MNLRKEARYRRASLNSMILGSIFVGCLSILFSSADVSRNDSTGSPVDTGVNRQRIDLSSDWSYAPDPGHRAPGELPSPPSEGWRNFDPSLSWRYADEIRGSYWFKKTFASQYGFQSPALVLGQIPGTHRVYLNGHLIGGSDQPEALAFYPFDGGFLSSSGSNTLLISAHAPATLSPGITKLKDLGMFIGDVQDVRQSSMGAQTILYVNHSILLSLSVGIFFVTLGYAIFRKAYRQYFYAALFMLLGSIHLAGLHPWIAGKLDLPHLRLLQSIALALSPFTLYSACLHLQRRYRAEAMNNGAALLTLAAISGWILRKPAPAPTELSQTFQYVAISAMIYALAWVSMTCVRALIPKLGKEKLRESQSPLFEAAFIIFGVIGAIAAFTNADGSIWAHSWSETWAKALPFVFSFTLVAAATVEHNTQRRASTMRSSHDELVSGLIRFIHDSPQVSETVTALQARISTFLKAKRSTLYLMDEDEHGQAVLKATYIHGDDKMRGKVSPALRPDDGVIGYVCGNRAPLLIDNIRQDPRFRESLAKKAQKDPESLYQTGACMILPLTYGDRFLGVLTFADKKDGNFFTQEDFAMAIEVSTDLAILLDSRQLQESIRQETRKKQA
ncbi:MAG: GAF domain-containing protein [Bdellovibrionia bacterium]